MTASPVTKGFLFADLRGYTAFVEREGDAAGAALLDRYRRLVRAEIARFEGAEIRTEGDSFYVVFPSASLALRCGVAIVATAAESADADAPVAVAIGVNAGETADTEEGPVGSAVNVAARVCAVARAGEVLITDTVRSLARGSVPLTFTSRGRHRLKGVQEPMQLYAAAATTEARPAARIRNRVAWSALLVASAGAAALAAAAATGGIPGLGFASPGSSSSVDPGSGAVVVPPLDPVNRGIAVPLAPGRYVLAHFRPVTEFDVHEPGWALAADEPDAFEIARLNAASRPEGYVGGARVDFVFRRPCADESTESLPESSRGVIDWLLDNPHVAVEDPRRVAYAGFSGFAAEVAYAQAASPPCANEDPALHLFPIADRTFRLDPGERVRVITVDVNGTPVSILVGAFDAARFDSFLSEAGSLVESLRLAP